MTEKAESDFKEIEQRISQFQHSYDNFRCKFSIQKENEHKQLELHEKLEKQRLEL